MDAGKSAEPVLVITPKPPYPKVDGGALAMANLLDMLRLEFEQVDLFCLHTPKHPLVPSAFPADLTYTAAFTDTTVRLHHIPRAVLGSRSYRVSRFYQPEADEALRQLLQQNTYRHIILESPYTSPYLDTIRSYSDARVFLRVHNIEFRIWEKIIRDEKNPVKRKWLQGENKKLQRLEHQLFSSVDGLICISPADWEAIQAGSEHAPGIVVPFTLPSSPALAQTTSHPTDHKHHLFHIGAMDWEPNREAMQWFLENVFPVMLTENPKLEFHMAGRSMEPRFLSWQQDHVTVHGEVKDAAAFMQNFDLMVVPLLSGSGIRIKIMEALMLGIPVVSTSVGLSGLDLQAGTEVLVADTPEAFGRIARELKEGQLNLQQLGQKGREKMLQQYHMPDFASRLRRFLLNLGNG